MRAFVYESNGAVFLRTICKTHGDFDVIICKNIGFFRRMLSFQASVKANDIGAAVMFVISSYPQFCAALYLVFLFFN